MVTFINRRRKALVAALGVVVSLLYTYNTTHPNATVSTVLAVLTVLGVHQTSNK